MEVAPFSGCFKMPHPVKNIRDHKKTIEPIHRKMRVRATKQLMLVENTKLREKGNDLIPIYRQLTPKKEQVHDFFVIFAV